MLARGADCLSVKGCVSLALRKIWSHERRYKTQCYEAAEGLMKCSDQFPSKAIINSGNLEMDATSGLGSPDMQRTLLVASEPPCSWGGAPMVLRNLFRNFPLGRLRVCCAGYMYKRSLKKGILLPHEHHLMPFRRTPSA